MKRFMFALTLILTVLLSNFYQKVESSPNDLVVHEWGTFTSVAGKNGMAIDWRPLAETSDLPKFVYSMDESDGFRETYETRLSGKTRTLAKVRMETPVIYFYTKHEQEVSVNVGFPGGKITEWYPQASVVNTEAGNNQKASSGNGINWGAIKLLPNEKPNFLRETSESHYYPARETDAVAVQVCNADKTKIEKEKFLFYRGVGNFELPLKVKLSDEKVVLNTIEERYGSKSNPGRNLTNLIVFENRGGKIGYEFVPTISGETVVNRPKLNKTLQDVFDELEKSLVTQGLYTKEAKAMIETWKNSWFEEGLRVFYLLPRMTTDEILPLQVEPRPKETVRVLVGRTEIITPEIEQDVRKQVGLLRSRSPKIREQAQAHLKKYGRFYEPILKNILETERDARVRAQIRELIEAD